MLFQENKTKNTTIKIVIQNMLLAKIDNNKENITPQNILKQKKEIQKRIDQNLRRN